MLRLHFVYTGIGEANSVDHAALEFSYAWGSRSMPALDTDSLGDESSQSIEIDDTRKLPTVRSGASGKQHRILKFDSRGGDC
jgi:hypothetical protein